MRHFTFSACSSVGCDGDYPICSDEGGECKITCGKTHYRKGDFCYHCDDNHPYCKECVADGVCEKCFPGYHMPSGTCEPCPSATYGTTGLNCQTIDNCTGSPEGQVTPNCQSCSLGNFISDGVCKPCFGFSYGTESSTCVNVSQCVDGIMGQSVPSCTKCNPGFKPDNGSCLPCAGNTYSAEGTDCVKIDFCQVAKDHKSKQCYVCEKGYGPDENGDCIKCTGNLYSDGSFACEEVKDCTIAMDNIKNACKQCRSGFEVDRNDECVACSGNYYSQDGNKCLKGADNCVISNSTRKKCLQCTPGYGITAGGECQLCSNGWYNSDGKSCLKSTEIENCEVYHQTENRCIRCAGGLDINHDNTCPACNNGEFVVNSTCESCPEGTYSIWGSLNCTSDCSLFGSSCENVEFCKMSLGSCVSSDDNTVLILGISAGGGGLLIVVLLVVLLVLWKIGWFAARGMAKKEQQSEDLEMATFEKCTVDVSVTPRLMTFGGQAVGPNEEVKETITIHNDGSDTILYGVRPGKCKDCLVGLGDCAGELKSGDSVDIEICCQKSIMGDVSGWVKVSVQSKKNKEDGKHIEVDFTLRGLGEYELNMADLVREKKIGEGACGVVYRGTYQGRDVAIKQIKATGNDAVPMFEREVEMLKIVHGKNIVVFYGATMSKHSMCHVTEFMDLGTLTDVMETHRLTPQLKIKIIRDIALGMETVHSFNVIHRDLKPDNVLCKSPLDITNMELCKITDFGASRAIETSFSMTMTKGQGTPLYMAPEIVSGQKRYTKAVDVYSYGVVCNVVWNDGRKPYIEYNFPNPLELQNAVLSGCRPQIDPDCPLVELIKVCWSPRSNERPTFPDITNMFMSL